MKTRILICFLTLLMTGSFAFAQVDTLWTARFTGDGNTVLLGAVALNDGGFALVGYTRVGSSDDFFAAKLDENGTLLWSRIYDSGPYNDRLEDVIELEDGSLFAVGSIAGETAMAFIGISADGDSLWSRTTDFKGMLAARDVHRLSNGNIAVLGYALGADSVHSDIWLIGCDPSGNMLWNRAYGGTETDTGTRLAQRNDGTLQLCGNFASSGSNGQSDFWTLHTEADGEPIGTQVTFGTNADERAYGVAVNSFGDVYLCGSRYTSNYQGFVAKLAADGSHWQRSYLEESNREYRGLVSRLGGVMCVGSAGTLSGRAQPFISMLDQYGEELWSWDYGVDEYSSGFYGVITVPTGGFLTYGSYRQNNVLFGFVVNIAPAGGISGIVRDIESGEPVPYALVSAIGVEGYTMSDLDGVYSLELHEGTYDLLVHGVCVDSSLFQGIHVAEREMTTFDLTAGVPRFYDRPTSINMFARDDLTAVGYYRIRNEGSGTLYYSASVEAISPSGDWISVAPSEGSIPPGMNTALEIEVQADVNSSGQWDYLGEIRVSTNHCPDTVDVIPVVISVLDLDGNRPEFVSQFELHSAYPNPFNSETTLRFDLPIKSSVEMRLFNLQGQLVKTLLSDQYSAGSYSVPLSLPDFPSGVYLVQLQAGELSATRKIVLLK